MSNTHVQDAVREKYGDIARSVGKTGCCGPTACGCGDPITSDLYSDVETAGLPADAVAVSLGCGNPTALIDLQPGQTVLDLGSGGGIDVLLSAKRVAAPVTRMPARTSNATVVSLKATSPRGNYSRRRSGSAVAAGRDALHRC